MALNGVELARDRGSYDDALLIKSGTGLQSDARDAIGARGTVGNASCMGFMANCVRSSPEYTRSAPLNACSHDSHLSESTWPTLPGTGWI